MLLTMLLKSRGFQVLCAFNGKEALSLLMELKKLPDLILLDAQMPVMDGHQATLLLRGDPRFNDLPILAMTAHALMGDRERCLSAEMDDYFSKPFNPDELEKKLADCASARLKAA